MKFKKTIIEEASLLLNNDQLTLAMLANQTALQEKLVTSVASLSSLSIQSSSNDAKKILELMINILISKPHTYTFLGSPVNRINLERQGFEYEIFRLREKSVISEKFPVFIPAITDDLFASYEADKLYSDSGLLDLSDGLDFVVHSTLHPNFNEGSYNTLQFLKNKPKYYAHFYSGAEGELLQVANIGKSVAHCGVDLNAPFSDRIFKNPNRNGYGIELANGHSLVQKGKTSTLTNSLEIVRLIDATNDEREKKVLLNSGLVGTTNVIRDAYSLNSVALTAVLIADLVSIHDVKKVYIVGHEDVSPNRKVDPGSHFPWHLLDHALNVLSKPALTFDDITDELEIPTVDPLLKYDLINSVQRRADNNKIDILDAQFFQSNILNSRIKNKKN